MNQYQEKVCTNRDCATYGLTQTTNHTNCEICKKKLKLRNGIDEPDNIVNGVVKSYGFRREKSA